MIKIKSSLSVLILTLFSSLVYANNDKGFLEYKKEDASPKVVVKQEINAELEMRLRKLEEQNKRLTDLLSKGQQQQVIVEEPKEELEEKIIEEETTTEITLQEKARLDAFDYDNFNVSGEAANYYILKDSQNRRKIVYKNEVELFNSKVKITNKKLASDKDSKLREN